MKAFCIFSRAYRHNSYFIECWSVLDSINPCSVNNGGCSHLCLLTATGNSGHSCNCPQGLELTDDSSNCTQGEMSMEKLAVITVDVVVMHARIGH